MFGFKMVIIYNCICYGRIKLYSKFVIDVLLFSKKKKSESSVKQYKQFEKTYRITSFQTIVFHMSNFGTLTYL